MPADTFPNPYAGDDSNNRPLRPFSSTVDGKPVAVTIDRKATQDGKDVTKELREIGLNDQQIFDNLPEVRRHTNGAGGIGNLTRKYKRSLPTFKLV